MSETTVEGSTRRGRAVVAAISDRPEFLQLVRSSVSTVPEYDLRDLSAEGALGGGAARIQPDIIILDVASGDILEDDRIFELRRAFVSVPMIAISQDLSPDRMRRLIQLNPADWLQEPLKGRALLDGISEQLQGGRIHRSEAYAFVPASGGAGATCLAIATAAHLARKSRTPNVCLVDLDFVGGSCGRYLDIENEFELEDVMKEPERIDLELLGILKRDHPAGFSLFSFRRPELQIADVTEEFVYRFLDVVTLRYPRVVIDLPGYPAPWAEQIIRNSDHGFLVAERTVPGLKNAKEMHDKLVGLGKTADSIHLILNKDRRRMFSVGIGDREIQKLFQSEPMLILPDNWPLFSEALNRGVPATMVNRRARLLRRLGRAFDKIVSPRLKT
jgi:pilus assembly protein CpaE